MSRVLSTHLALLLALAACAGCTQDDAPSRQDAIVTADTPDAASDDTAASMCPCAGGACPEGLCDVRVVLDENCRPFIDEAVVTVDGEALGTATIEAPFVSCQAWPCETTLEIEVRSTAISTGKRMLSVALDPDVPLSCDGL